MTHPVGWPNPHKMKVMRCVPAIRNTDTQTKDSIVRLRSVPGILRTQPVAQSDRMNHRAHIFRSIFVVALICAIGAGTCGLSSAADSLHVEIKGIEGDLLDNVETYLGIAQKADKDKKGLFSTFSQGKKKTEPQWDERSIRRMHRMAPQEIRRALQPFGYYSPEIDAALAQKGGIWQAVYVIDRGPPTMLRQVQIDVSGEGRDLPAVKAALSSIRIEPGRQLDHREYERAKSALSDTLYQAGFVDAKFTRSEFRVNPEKRQADLFLLMTSGPQFHFGPITIEQEILRPEFVARLSTVKEGDRFNPRKLLDLQLALQDSGYFSQAEILAEREKAVGNRIPVVVKTVPTKPRRYSLGFGFGTDTGPRFTAGTEWRRLNDRGHKLQLALRLSAIEQSLNAQYHIPLKNILTESLTLTGSASREEIGDIDTDQFKVGASLNENWMGFRRRLYLFLERENFDIGNGNQTSDLLMPGLELSRRSFDDLIYPRRGYSASIDVHGGLESPLTETTFLHTRITARSVWPLTRRGRLLFRGEFGAIRAETFSDLPPSQRFYAGGDQSVRGYGYQELGPENDDGDVIGGKYLAIASIEADYLIYNNIGAAVFFDAGDASDEFAPDLKRSVGIGLRYRSPVAMIRLDVAHPLDDPDETVRFHISIGADL